MKKLVLVDLPKRVEKINIFLSRFKLAPRMEGAGAGNVTVFFYLVWGLWTCTIVSFGSIWVDTVDMNEMSTLSFFVSLRGPRLWLSLQVGVNIQWKWNNTTLRKTNSSPLKMLVSNRNLQTSRFSPMSQGPRLWVSGKGVFSHLMFWPPLMATSTMAS